MYAIEILEPFEGALRSVGHVGPPGGPGYVSSVHQAARFDRFAASARVAELKLAYPSLILRVVPAPRRKEQTLALFA